MTTPTRDRIDASVRFIRELVPETCDIGLILGSGLGDFADSFSNKRSISASEVPNFPVSGVEGHEGKLVFASRGGKSILVFQGRTHFYESNDFEKVLHPVRVAAELGIRTLIVTNAAGGINPRFGPGTLMAITDQIDLTFEVIPGHSSTPRDSSLYDKELIALTGSVAARSGLSLARGVYAGVKGPSYETAAEIEMIRRLGGDAVGMSTVKEVLLAAGLGIRVMGISCITNMGTGIAESRLNHAEVNEVASKVKREFTILLSDLISLL